MSVYCLLSKTSIAFSSDVMMSPNLGFICFLLFSTFNSGRSFGEQKDFKKFRSLHDAYLRFVHLSNIPEVFMGVRRRQSVVSKLESTGFNNQNFRNNASESSLPVSKCASDVSYTLTNIHKRWAIQMLDANAKIPSGMINGNFLWTGNYRECMDVSPVNNNKSASENFHGQYCSVSWDIRLPSDMPASQLPLLTGICIPDSCNGTALSEDLKYISEFLAETEFTRKYSSILTLKTVNCIKEHEKLSYPAVGFIILLCAFGMLMVIGTCVTLCTPGSLEKGKRLCSMPVNGFIINSPLEEQEHTENEDSALILPANHRSFRTVKKSVQLSIPVCCKVHIARLRRIVECFSITVNGSKILDTGTSDGQLLCLHGIRFFSMAWVILGHTYVHCLKFIDNIVDVLHDLDNWPSQVVVHGTFSVDTFFLISGFLLTYLFLRKADTTEGRIPWKFLYIHRYLRLTPPYAVLIGFNTLLFSYFGSGPFWGEESDTELCKENWWWNLLYISNFLNIDNMCAAWTWYLANDMQFFVVSSLFLYALWRWSKLGINIVLTLLISSWITTWVISDIYKIKPMFYGLENSKNYSSYQEEMYQSWDKIYSKPYCRIGPYLIGVLLGYILHQTGEKKGFLKSWHIITGWCMAIFFSLNVLYGFYKCEGNQLTFNFYNALSRSSFSLGVAWVIYICLTEHAGVINALLSYKLWIPLSRLTYCAYLIHPLLMKWYFQRLQEPLQFTQTVIVMHFFGFLLVSYGIGFFVAVAFESPVRNFEKFLSQK